MPTSTNLSIHTMGRAWFQKALERRPDYQSALKAELASQELLGAAEGE